MCWSVRLQFRGWAEAGGLHSLCKGLVCSMCAWKWPRVLLAVLGEAH